MSKEQMEEIREIYFELYTEAKQKGEFNFAGHLKDELKFIDEYISRAYPTN